MTQPAARSRSAGSSLLEPAAALPVGTHLIHIGPHKTGTTSVQGALHDAREALLQHGVRYAGRQRHSLEAAVAVTGAGNLLGGRAPRDRHWQELVQEVQQATQDRVVVSSEFLSEADPAARARILRDLGGDGPHVLVTLRPLASILPSQWQQYVQNGLRATYAQWLKGMFLAAPYTKPTPSFWRRHAHADLVQRWAKDVGPANLTVLVVDDADRRMLMDRLEDLLALPHGLLQPRRELTNRSLRVGEIELVRRLNAAFRSESWPEAAYDQYIRYGAVKALQLRTPAADEARIRTPAWALDRAAELGREHAERIAGLGVNVLGDLSGLGSRPADAGPFPDVTVVPTDVALTATVGAMRASGALGDETSIERRPVSEVAAKDLVRVIGRRVRRKRQRLLGR